MRFNVVKMRPYIDSYEAKRVLDSHRYTDPVVTNRKAISQEKKPNQFLTSTSSLLSGDFAFSTG